MYKWSCYDCRYLNKSRRKYNGTGYCFLFGCDKRKYVIGWIKTSERTDKGLKEMGCSEFREKDSKEQLSLF